MNTLLLITGAGASFDCINKELVSDETIVFRPPLTIDLFPFHSIIGAAIDPYSLECLKSHPAASQIGYNLFSRFRNNRDEMNLEQYLAELKNSKIKAQRSQFWAVPLYLFELFMRISKEYTISATPGVPSNYKLLIDKFNMSNYTQLIWLNLNYDLLADFAIKHSIVNQLNALEDYMNLKTYDGKIIKYTKPHGSIDWFKIQDDPQILDHEIKLGRAPDNFESLLKKKQICKAGVNPDGHIKGRPHNGYPAITVPLGAGYEFVYQDHIDAITPDLKDVKSMLCIGFNALDKDILNLIKNNINIITKFKIVNGNKESARQVYSRITSYCDDKISPVNDPLFKGGFTEFVQEEIDEFLKI